ncbi:MAG: histidine phosphatase family protein [Acidobacteria bacterium]|jgi:probable phosphoglycerate mutase|nr:histidine phosphatase family protein [Acidobacteriota bacterium]
MKTIYLIRHGETQANREGVFRGRGEVPLSPQGLKQAEELRAHFADLKVQRVFSSPLRRAAATAAACFPGRAIELQELVNNLDLGGWSGRKKKEIAAEEPELWRRWLEEPERMSFPGGESLAAVKARARAFNRLLAAAGEERIAVVSHRSVIKCLLAEALGLGSRWFWKFHLDNASVTMLLHDPLRGFVLAKLNDTTHLSAYVFEWD